MKILLISPPFYRFLGSVSNDIRLSLGYISAVTRKLGHEVYQYNPDSGNEFASQNELFDNSAIFEKLVNNIEHPIYREIFHEINKHSPDVVGLTILSGTVIQSEIIAKYCKSQSIHTIAGGPMVTLAIDKIMECNAFDQLVAGEAESVMKRVITNKHQRVIVGIPTGNLNKIPYPDRDNYVGNYLDKINRAGILSSRGCPFQCPYCSHWIMSGEIRYRDGDNVIGELKELKEKYNQKFIRFFDDHFLTNRHRVIDLCVKMKKDELNLEFLIETRAQGLDQSIIDILKSAGLRKVKLGIESGSQKILNIYKQGLKKDVIRETVFLLKKSGIDVSGNFMYGFPEETNFELQETIDFIQELDCSWTTISSLAPYYGTEMYELLSEEKKRDWRYFFHNQKVPVMNSNLSSDLIEKLLQTNIKQFKTQG